MLLIDINNQEIVNNTTFEPNVLVLRGASDNLINSLASYTFSPKHASTQNRPATPASNNGLKVALGGKSTKTTTGDSFGRILEELENSWNTLTTHRSSRLNNVLKGITNLIKNAGACDKESCKNKSYRIGNTVKTVPSPASMKKPASRKNLQKHLVKLLTGCNRYMENLRSKTQASTILNPTHNTVTTRNIKAALALYTYYGATEEFTFAEAISKIANIADVNYHILGRLANELYILRVVGSNRYSVRKEFGNQMVKVFQDPRYKDLLEQVNYVQDRINAVSPLPTYN